MRVSGDELSGCLGLLCLLDCLGSDERGSAVPNSSRGRDKSPYQTEGHSRGCLPAKPEKGLLGPPLGRHSGGCSLAALSPSSFHLLGGR